MSQVRDSDKIETGGSRIKFWGGAVIVLMIVLMFLPWNIGNKTHHNESVLRGTASDGRKVMSADTDRAAAALDLLEQVRVSVNNPLSPQSGIDVPLLTALWGEDLVTEMKNHPEAYHLLVQESRKFGLGDNPRALGPLNRDSQNNKIEGIFNSGLVYVRELHPLFGSELYAASRSIAGPAQLITQVFMPKMQNDGYVSRLSLATLPPIDQERLYYALRDLLSVQAASSLASTAVKPSTTMIDQLIARQAQTFTLQVAGIDAKPFIDAVTVPSDAELQAHLAKYADLPPGTVTPENPFGFGYQQQNAVKLQLLMVNRADVRAVVQAEKSDYDWEVEARMAYARDPKQFASLAAQPTTNPTTTNPTTAPAAQAGDVAPFDQIKAAAVRRMVDVATAARMDEITRKIRTTMSLDYQTWAAAKNTNATTRPSSLGVMYDSVDYLNKLAAAIQAEPRFKVLPIVSSQQSEFLDREELATNESLANLNYTFEPNVAAALQIRPVPIPASLYVSEFTKPFMQKPMIAKAGGAVLEVMKPSDLLQDPIMDRVAFLRVTDVQLAHAATDIEPIRARLVSDVKRVQAQEKAIEMARAAVQGIKTSRVFQVADAASSTVVIEPLQNGNAVPPELGLDMRGFTQFHLEMGRKLLGEPDGKPVDVLSVPLAQKVFVAQRMALVPLWNSQVELDQMRVELQNAIDSALTAPGGYQNQFGVTDKAVANQWVNIQNVFTRNDWKSARGSAEKETSG